MVLHGMVIFYGIPMKVSIVLLFDIGSTCRLPHSLVNNLITRLCVDPLMFVLKLDEVEIMSGKKGSACESYVNDYTLDPSIQKDGSKYF